MPDLSVDLCGVRLANPLILASGPLAWNGKAIRAALDAGAAAVVTKTIRPEGSVDPVPHIAPAGRRSMLNIEGWSHLPAEQWIEGELPSLRKREGVVIASTGHTPAEVEELARPLADAGADLLELVSYDAQDAAPMAAAAKAAVSIPVLVKVSANWSNLQETVSACLAAGADGFTAIDSVGPTLAIDVETGRPRLGSFAWLSGEAIRPIAVQAVAGIRLEHDVAVVGTGGVTRAEDVVEMVMAGASAVGVHTAPLLSGMGWFARTLQGLERWMEDQGVASLDEIQAAALPWLRDEPSPGALSFAFDREACTRCGRCVTVCAYGARTMTGDGEMVLDRGLCRSCGLCASVCPTDALRSAPRP
jgi:dihydroorotate dehydrogenase (fumarate)